MIRPMNRGEWHRRPLLLAVAASTGVITGHVLDALGQLPGVQEAPDVRAAALAPHFTVLTVLGAALLAVLADGLLRRGRPAQAVLALVVGQSALLGLPEVLAEATGRAATGGGGGEAAELTKLGLAVGLQVVIATAAIAVAVVVDRLLPRLPGMTPGARAPAVSFPVRSFVVVLTGRIVGGVRGRGPPVLLFR